MTVMIQSARRLIAGLLCSLAVFGFSTLGLAGESGFARPVVDDAIPAYPANPGVVVPTVTGYLFALAPQGSA